MAVHRLSTPLGHYKLSSFCEPNTTSQKLFVYRIKLVTRYKPVIKKHAYKKWPVYVLKLPHLLDKIRYFPTRFSTRPPTTSLIQQ